MKISTNIAALGALGNIAAANKMLTQSSLRLSSGTKINSAKDDAAGFAISNKLRNQIGGTYTANRNTMNGISIVQTADGALSTIHDMLQRMRELSIQAANDTVELDDRQKIQEEIDQLVQEIDSTVAKTEYNKINLFRGSGSALAHAGNAAGAEVAEILRISDTIKEGEYKYTINALAEKASYEVSPSTVATSFPDASLAGTITINDMKVEILESDTIESAYEKILLAAESNDLVITRGDNDTILGSVESKYAGSKYNFEITSDNALLLDKLGLGTINYTNGTDADISLIRESDDPESKLSDSSSYKVDGNKVTIFDSNGREIVMRLSENATLGKASVSVEGGGLLIQIGANKDTNMEINLPRLGAESLGIDKINMLVQDRIQEAIVALDDAIALVSHIRSKVGSYQNRLEQTVVNLDLSATNMEGSLSRIYDTDMASEMTEYTKYQVISQAGISVMAQANQRPQQVLQLLN